MFFKIFCLLGLAPAVLAKVQFLGVAIAGGDFGCEIDGTCSTGSTQLPIGNDGTSQMQHFVEDDGLNLLRLPVSWQFLTNNQLGASLDRNNLAKYDQLMQACLATGAYCMIDIHNFARWNGEIIGQGSGPTDDDFVGLWSQLATKYASEAKVVFELMNEPHDLDINIWAQTCQKAVTAIREAGASAQMILLPGTNFDSAATLVSTGSADALFAVTNPDGTTDNLLLDIHKYLDEDNSGTHAQCTTDNVDAFGTLAAYLREKGRKGFVSETGASSDSSCFTSFCAQNTFINENADVFVGLVGWGAGSFGTDYVLSLTPTKQGSSLVDSDLMTQCVISPWINSNDSDVQPSSSITPTTSIAPTTIISQTAIASPSSTLSIPTTLLLATSSPEPVSRETTESVGEVEMTGTRVILTATLTTTWQSLFTADGATPTGSGFGTSDSNADATESADVSSPTSSSSVGLDPAARVLALCILLAVFL
ncbi:endoglucanase 2 [Xylariomycetidae sp. FL2044]|nr:endoglucanase 2 [Xylariomycetidae sp. FL2044]